MNSLSWFIYGADVVGNVSHILSALLCFTLLAWTALNISVPVTEGEVLEWEHYSAWWRRGLYTLVIGGFALAFIPSKNTLYAIAASEIGETVAKHDAVQSVASDAAKALHSWIKKQIEPSK
jgi:hypothetical protein